MAIPATHLESYKKKFDQYQNGGFILGKDAPAIFGPFKLPKTELFQIWSLADTGKKGRIEFAPFARACHMAYLAAKGEPYLEVELPVVAINSGGVESAPTESTEQSPATPTNAAASGQDATGTEEPGETSEEGDSDEFESGSEEETEIHFDEEAEARAKAERKAAKAEWKAKRQEEQDAKAREEYEARLKKIEDDLAASNLGSSGAPKPRKQGRGSIRQGRSFKNVKPAENFLAPRAANEIESKAAPDKKEEKQHVPAETKAPAVEAKPSVWTLSKSDLFHYKALFSKHAVNGAVVAKSAPMLFAPYGLDQNTMREIWVMADVGRKGKLASFEFIVAMHLIVCIAQRGAKMPESVPFELTNECILAVVSGKPLPPPGMGIFRQLCKQRKLRKQATEVLLMRALRDIENAEFHGLAQYHAQLKEKYLLSLKDAPFNQAANVQARLQARIATIGASLAERPWRPASIPMLHDDDPITIPFVQSMLLAFRRGEFLSYENAWQILKRISAVLTQERTVQYTTIDAGCRMVVVGDLHGQLDDFLYVLHNSGLPSATNHILFNGDFVDRGSNSCEVVFSIFALKLACPGWVFLNRGNHEAAEINEANGFAIECTKKYDRELFCLFSDTFACLPLAHVLNNKIFVVHGGLSWQDFKVEDLNNVNRFIVDPVYGTLMSDLLWSDPDQNLGRAESRRGTGCHFGPDIVQKFLAANNLDIIIRSHEVCDGVEYWFDGTLITVFSASNYCGDTGNIGGFIVVDPNLKVSTTTYQEDQLLTAEQKADKAKSSAVNLPKCVKSKLRALILEKRAELDAEFANTPGPLTATQWGAVLRKVLGVRTPFASLTGVWGLSKEQAIAPAALLEKMTEQ